MSSINFTGLGSGIETSTIIDALVQTQRLRKIQPYENWKTEWANKISAFQTLNTKLSTLHQNVKSIDTPSEFNVKTVSTTETDVVTATAGSTALNGAYKIEVAADSKHRLASRGYSDSDTTAYANQGDTLSLTVGTTTATVILNLAGGGELSLDEIAAAINNSANWSGATALVSAEVINDGTGAQENRLVLTAASGGKANSIVINSNTTDVDFSMSTAGDRIDAAYGLPAGIVTSGGTYSGTTNKTFTFAIQDNGSGLGEYTVGTDSFDIAWSDTEGNSGTVSVTETDFSSIDIFQGVTLSFAADSPVYPNDFFTVDVWHPDLQLPQDDGLAKAEKEIHSGFIDQDTTPVTTETSSFSYTYNGKQRTLSVDDGTTLSQLVDQINNDSLNPGVTASIIDDGSGLSTAYHLVLTGDDTGSAYKIESINTTFTQSLFTNGSFSESQSAQNAMLKIDGYPTGDNYLQRTSNTITDVIAGLTLALTGAGTSTVTVNNDTEAIKQNISDFVDAFNDIRRYIKEQTSYDTETEESGILLGNYGIDTIKNRLNSITSSVPSGFRTSEDTYVNLMQLGISTDANTGSETSGELVIDYAALDEALTADPQAVADFFSEYFTGRSTSDSMSYDSYIPGITDPGTYFVEFNGGASPTARVRASGSDTWYSAEWDATSETITVSGGAGSGLSIRIGDPSLSFSGEIDLKRGLAGDLKEELDFLSNADSGPLGVLEENYNDIIDMIETKIENEEERIALYEQRLVERYARLEQVLTELNAQSRSLDSLTAQLS